MLTEDDITQQKTILETYRRNVKMLLLQTAQYNGELNAPLPLLNNLQEAREHISQVKTILRANNINIDDHPDDIPLARRTLDEAVGKQAAQVSENERSQVLRRAQFARSILEGSQILWVDDIPSNNIYERRLFRSLGIFIDLARSTEEALEMMQFTKYNVIISDIARGEIRDAGIQFLDDLNKLNYDILAILYTGAKAAARGVPKGAFAITARPDHLLHYIIDALEREKI